jgi:5-methylcytosine-specific restriction endonuclease McrA
MPRIVTAGEKDYAIRLMLEGKMSQRDMEKETGLSRPYLRKLAREIGYQFPRNGVEVIGKICMCSNCSTMFRRPPSKAERAKNQFCDTYCKEAFMKGPLHPSWKHGKSAATFSQWVKNQSEYHKFREAVLERDGYKCQVSGRTDNLQVHHILPKAEGFSPEKAFDPENGMTLNFDVHQEIHELIRDGLDYEEAIQKLKQKYNNV